MSLRFPSAITNRPRSLAAFTVFSNASMRAEPYCSKKASCGFTAGTRSATESSTSSWKSLITERIISRVGALWLDCIKAGMSSMRGSSPTTQGFPLLRTASTSRSENGCMNLYYCPTRNVALLPRVGGSAGMRQDSAAGCNLVPVKLGTSVMNLPSYTISQGKDRAPARSYFKAIGFTDEDLKKPVIGIANTWIGTMPCNFLLRDLAVKVAAGIRQAGGTPMESNTIAISDGITMGTEGMKTSLVSRDLIADSIELVARGHMFDGVIALVGCDKTIPGAAMALLRLNVPGLVLYGGSILPGHYKGRDLTIQDVFEAVGANAAGKITDQELLDIENAACPGAGACGGQFTANTMATVMEIIGLSPMGTAAVPQVDPRKNDVAMRCGEVIVNAVKQNLRPRDIVTRKSIENAIASVAATGGSTTAVLHLIAIAREAGVPLEIDNLCHISNRTPILVDLKPGGRFVAVDVDKAGGIGVIARRLVDGGYVDGSALTCTGLTFAEEAAKAVKTPGQEVIRPLNKPLKPTGGLAILRGSLAPEGCVIKLAGHDKKKHRGPARVFNREEDAMAAGV